MFIRFPVPIQKLDEFPMFVDSGPISGTATIFVSDIPSRMGIEKGRHYLFTPHRTS